MIVKEERVNLGRQREFDIVKALAILFMVIIHVYEEMSVADYTVICSKPLDVILQFLGGPLAAPVFMFSLGLGLSYSSHRAPIELFKRGLYLFIFSYVFNLLRYVIPYFISEGFTNVSFGYILYLTFHVDILTFAGMTFLVFALLKKIKVPVYGVVIIAVVLQGVGLIINSLFEFESTFSVLFGAIFVKTGEPSYFPFFQWFIYPSLGLLYAKYLRHVEDTDKLYLTLLGVSGSLMLSFCVALSYLGFDVRTFFTLAEEQYYDQTFLHTVFCLLCILIELSIMHFILKVVHIKPIENVIAFMSGKLNNIYIVQWMIIGWLSYFIVPISDVLSIPVGIAITALSTVSVYFYVKFKKKKQAVK